MEFLPENILLRLRQSQHLVIRLAAIIVLERIAGQMDHFEVDGVDDLLALNEAINPLTGVREIIENVNSITFTAVRIRDNRRRNLNNAIRAAMNNVMMLPELQHIHFQDTNIAQLVPTIVNPSLTRITMDIARSTAESRAQFLRLCIANGASLQELLITGLTDAVVDLVFNEARVLFFPQPMQNVFHMVLRFRLSTQGRPAPPVVLPIIMDSLPQLAFLDIKNLGSMRRAEQRNALFVTPEVPNPYPNLQASRIATRDFTNDFSEFIRLQLPELRGLYMHGDVGYWEYVDVIHQLHNIGMEDRNGTVTFLQFEDNRRVREYVALACFRFPDVREIRVVNSRPDINTLDFAWFLLERVDLDISFLMPLAIGAAAFQAGTFLITGRQIELLRLYAPGFDQVLDLV
ncbi:hypothetical protein MBANPS3_010567 [Mucor bainieri]